MNSLRAAMTTTSRTTKIILAFLTVQTLRAWKEIQTWKLQLKESLRDTSQTMERLNGRGHLMAYSLGGVYLQDIAGCTCRILLDFCLQHKQFFVFPEMFVTPTVRKYPTVPTPESIKQLQFWNKFRKIPNHKSDTAIRWCIQQMPSCDMPS